MRTLTILLPLLLATALAEDPLTQKEALSEALYTEEVLRDPEAAATQYTQILQRYRTQRVHAATALFRLAEMRRNEGRNEDAITFYQDYLRSFSDLDPQASLAREQLATLGATATPSVPPSFTDAEAKELARLEALLKTAPDVVTDPAVLANAAGLNHLRVIAFLLANGSDPWRSEALSKAVSAGYLEAAKKLIQHNPKVPDEIAFRAVWTAYHQDRRILLTYLLDLGFPMEEAKRRSPSLLMLACANNDRATVDDLLARGSKIDWLCDSTLVSSINRSALMIASPLHTAISNQHIDLALHLLEKGASASLKGNAGRFTKFEPLHLAAGSRAPKAPELIRMLISKGANISASTGRTSSSGAHSFAGRFSIRGEKTPMEISVLDGLAPNAEALIKAGAPLSPELLFHTIENLPVFEAILAGGVDLNTLPKSGRIPEFTIFENLCYDTDTTPAQVDLMIAHGAILNPEWIIKHVAHPNGLKLQKHLLTHFRKNENFKYRSSMMILVIPFPIAAGDGLAADPHGWDLRARAASENLAKSDSQVVLTQVQGTDLLRFSCYGSTPVAAKSRADSIVLKLKTWGEEHRQKELLKNGEQAMKKFIVKAELLRIHEKPSLPTEEVPWK